VNITKETIVGVLLANTPSRRICCADKCLKKLMGRPVLTHVIDRVSPQVSTLVLNANGDPTRFGDISMPVVPDSIDDISGVILGILTGMEWAQTNQPKVNWVATFATDTPCIPIDLVERLGCEIEISGADMAYSRCGKRAHPEFGLWPVELAEDLRYAMQEGEISRFDKWSNQYNVAILQYPTEPLDFLTSANNIDAILAAEHLPSVGVRTH